MKAQHFKEVILPKGEKDTIIPTGLQQRAELEQNLASIQNSWARIYAEQSAVVAKLRIDKDEKFGKLHKYYRFDDDVTWTASETKSQIMSNPEYLAICRSLTEQEYYLEYIEKVLSIVMNLHFYIKEFNGMKTKMGEDA